MNGIIFNVQKFCLNDGPGIRTTVFFKGCPLRCKWCHNPESFSTQKQIMFYPDKCAGCGKCKSLTTEDSVFFCPNGAKEICGKTVSSEEVIAEVVKDKIFYEKSGGGMTLSGGEPLFQADFALDLLKKAKENGINTAIETCGAVSPETIRRASELTDIFLFDYKETDPALHKEYTGVSNEAVLSNLRLLDNLGNKIILRCPIIPGYNDRADHFDGICKTAKDINNIERVEIEPYHSLGESKYSALGFEPPKISVPTDEQKNAWLDHIKEKCSKPVRFA